MKNKEVIIEKVLMILALCISLKMYWGNLWAIIYSFMFIGGILFAIKISISKLKLNK